MFFIDGILYYADASMKKVIKYSVDDQDILATLYTKSKQTRVARRIISSLSILMFECIGFRFQCFGGCLLRLNYFTVYAREIT